MEISVIVVFTFKMEQKNEQKLF